MQELMKFLKRILLSISFMRMLFAKRFLKQEMNECTELLYQSVIFVAGAGRGPLVDRAITASEGLSKSVEIYAIEKNSNAVVG